MVMLLLPLLLLPVSDTHFQLSLPCSLAGIAPAFFVMPHIMSERQLLPCKHPVEILQRCAKNTTADMELKYQCTTLLLTLHSLACSFRLPHIGLLTTTG